MAAERSLHVSHHIVVVAVVERLHRVLVQEIEGLQKSGAGCQQDCEQDFGEETSRREVSFHPPLQLWGATGAEEVAVSHGGIS